MIFKWISCFIIVLTGLKCYSQVDSILLLPAERFSLAVLEFYFQHKQDSSKVQNTLIELKQRFRESNKVKEEKMVFSLLLDSKLRHASSLEGAIKDSEAAIQEAEKRKWKDKAWEARLLLGGFYFNAGHYGRGLEMMLKAEDELSKIKSTDQFALLTSNIAISDVYYRFGDYPSTIRFLKKVVNLNIPKESPAYPYPSLNTLGLAYQKMMEYDSAIHYLQLSNEIGRIQNDSFWVALTNGNLGQVYYKKGDLDKAAELVKADYEGSIKAGVYGSAVNAGTLLANIELQRGHTERIEEYIRFSRTYMDTGNIEGMIGYFRNMFAYNKLKGEYQEALLYADSLDRYQKRYDKVIDQNMLDQTKLRVQIDKYNTDVKLLEAAKDRQILMRNALIVILLLLALIGIMWFKRIQQNKLIADQKLEQAQRELNMYTKSLMEKNEIIQSIREQLDTVRSSANAIGDERSANISELINTSILTDEDWRQFRQLFDVVYPGFLVRLKEKLTDLTPAETRLLALTKLQIPPKDMANMLGISADSIKKTKYRLRKKLNLPEEGSLEELVSII